MLRLSSLETLDGSGGMMEFDDSRASTAASVSDLPAASTPRGKLLRRTSSNASMSSPTDFGFLQEREKPVRRENSSTSLATEAGRARKARRIASPMNRQLQPSSPPGMSMATGGRNLDVCGPELIQTLRGRLFGREAALILCGEAHEDAIDLTRREGILTAALGWLAAPLKRVPIDPEKAIAKKSGLTIEGAKEWAEEVLEKLDEDQETIGSLLVFSTMGRTRGLATLYPPGVETGEQIPQHPRVFRGVAVFEWGDTDAEAREFHRRRISKTTPPMSVEEQDSIIAGRKAARLEEGIELFDDWLIRQASGEIRADFVMEAPVSAHDVELHVEPGLGPAPAAHECLRRLELDTEEDHEQKSAPGNGSFLDYLRRQVVAHLPLERVHFIDPRMLGDAEDDSLPEAFRGSFQTWVSDPLEASESEQSTAPLQRAESTITEAELARGVDDGPGDGSDDEDNEGEEAPLPSWEAFLGGAADLLYYAPHVKADYTPFLTGCVGSAAKLRKFHEALYFKTVPEALAEINLTEKTRSMASLRSVAYQPPGKRGAIIRRPMGRCNDGRRLLPVRSAPVDRYLKARGFNPPRTWVSGLGEQLRLAGATDLLNAAKAFYMESANKMLADPKDNDIEGDNFVAWLRACHPDIYHDIDTHDPAELKSRHWAPSKTGKQRYNLKDIKIPSFEAAFAELAKGKQLTHGQPSTSREQVLSKILVDAFQLRLVDLAMILKMANIILSAPEKGRVVVVVYAGLDHTRNVTKFWQERGFSSASLPKKGLVGQERYDEDEPRSLTLPSYLHDFQKLFPVPASLGDSGAKATSRA
eukprot:TRINITY_DN37013_c0_g1_i1.p1 TRINITY_DN37013_c0_g1~~TRINITY_DN37013_c0_g1_i1.p1  ORF type:complete len:814 (-),score=181.21 TRINITY_DN37013_c0_g1_i1:99-2540(-)